MLDYLILGYLYSKKNDGHFYDVSLQFKLTNYECHDNEIEGYAKQVKQEGTLAMNNPNKILYNHPIAKNVIDNYVITLEENGYVKKRVEGFLPFSSLTSIDDPLDANNSICRITSSGINYYETIKQNHSNRMFSIYSLIISIIALIISFFLL